MAFIKITSECPLYDGMPVTFKAPCDCTEATGLRVYYNGESQSFTFRDAHGSTLTGIGNLFAEGVYVKVILDTTEGYAYIQNADTNKYIEDKFKVFSAEVDEKIAGIDELVEKLVEKKVGDLDISTGAAVTELDFSNFDNGSFTEVLDDGTETDYSVTFDSDGNPVSVGGVSITWG